MSPIAPSLSESSVDPSLMILSASSGLSLTVLLRPGLKILRELVVRDDVNRFESGTGARLSRTHSIIGLPATSRSGFAFVQRERVKSRGVTGGKDQDIHDGN